MVRYSHGLIAIFLVMFLLQFSNASTSTHSPTAVFDSQTLASPTSGNQTSPCLQPSAADISSQAVQPGISNGTVPGNVAPDVRNRKFQYMNRTADSFPLQMQFVFKLRNQAQFQNCLQSITDPRSTNYGNFLNASMLQPYLPTPGQKTSVVKYLTDNGFMVTPGASPLVLKVYGSSGMVSRVFSVKMGFYSRSADSTFYAADSDPTLPMNLATLVGAITGLDNYTSFRHLESPCNGPYCPQGIQAGYSFTSLYSSGYDGTGQKVAIVDEPGDPNIQTAINTFNTQYGLPSITLDIRYPNGVPSSYDPGWASETAMDVEAVHSVAPGAGIVLLYDSVDLMNAVDYVATNNLAKIVSNSWTYDCSGACSDTQLSHSFVSSVDSRLALDASRGLTILFASGDEGAKPDGTNFGTEFPASDPNVLAIGATNLVLAGSCRNTCTGYGSETGASISGGGYSGFFTEPSWQSSSIGTKTGRAVPDVSMLGFQPSFWVYSTASDKCGSGGNSAGWFGCAGTSLSTPLWAGFIGIMLQMKGNGSFGNIAPRIYQVASGTFYSAIFHDITSGSNGYSALVGWDPVTGWGTPVANLLAQAVVGVTMNVSYSVMGGGSPNAPVFNYVQNGASKNYTLTLTQTAITVDFGTLWSVSPNPLVGSGSTERWESNQALTGTVSGKTVIFTFYRQFLQTLSFSIVGGGNGFSSPIFSASSFGASAAQTLTLSPVGYWFDSGSSWSVTNPLSGSTGSEQWVTSQFVSGSISSAQTIAFTFQHQYYLTMQVILAGGTVSPTSGWQNAGVTATIRATPSSGYSFGVWSGSGVGSFSGSSNPSIVMMNGPIMEAASFLAITTTSLTVSPSTVSVGSSLMLNGSIVPNPGIVQVTLSFSRDTGLTWTSFLAVTTTGTGSYSTGWTPQYPGNYLVQASFGGNSQFTGSTSSSMPLSVTGSVSAPSVLLTTPATAIGGQPTRLSMTVFNPTNSPLTTNVSIQITGPANYNLFDVIQVKVSATSQSTAYYDWSTPTQPGGYMVTVEFLSTRTQYSDTSAIQVTNNSPSPSFANASHWFISNANTKIRLKLEGYFSDHAGASRASLQVQIEV